MVLAIVAVLLVGGGAYALGSGDGDESSSGDSTTTTDDDEPVTTQERRTTTTERTTTTFETTTSTTWADDVIDPSTGMLPGYTTTIVTEWVDACSQDGDPARPACQCVMDTVTTTVPFVDFLLWFTSADPGSNIDPAIQSALDQCGVTAAPQGAHAARR